MNNKYFFILFVSLALSFSAFAQGLQKGDTAPDFTLAANDGTTYTLSSLAKKHTVVVYFYPRAMTPGCTKQACAIRDSIDEFAKRNIIIIGISVDSIEAIKQFTAKDKLNFPLLADYDGSVAKKYGVYNPEKNFARRVSFVIDERMVIVGIIPKVDVNTHIQDVLHILSSSN